jgi:hypothetical protein
MMPFNAPATGTFRVVFIKDEGVQFIDFEATEGEPMVVPLTGLNEFYTHRFYIIDPEESTVIYEHTDGLDYDCFQVRIVPAQEREVTMIRLSGVTCENLLDPEYGLTEAQLEDCLGCDGGEACPMTVRIYVNGVLDQTILNVDPCEDQTYNIQPT